MQRPFPAYRGDEAYLFVSYAHDDAESVYPQLVWLRDQGFNLWYDEGIGVGAEWRESIARAIKGSQLLLYFVSPSSVASETCRKEAGYAMDEGIPIIAVHLEPAELTEGLKLALADRQAIFRFELEDAAYRDKLRAGIEAQLAGRSGRVQQAGAHRVERRRKRWPLALALVAVGLLTAGGWFVLQLLPGEISLVLHRFSAPGGDSDDRLALQLQDDIALHMASEFCLGDQCVPLRLIPDSGGSEALTSEPGQTTRADYRVQGTLVRSGAHTRVTARLLDGDDGSQLWSRAFELDAPEEAGARTEIARQIAHLAANLAGMDSFAERMARLWRLTRLRSLEAAGFFARAWREHYLRRLGEGGDAGAQVRYLEKAIDADPNFLPAYWLLANAYVSRLHGTLSLQEAASAARAALAQAREINPDDPEVLTQEANVLLMLELDFRAADEALQRLSALRPHLASPLLYRACIAVAEGREPAARRFLVSAGSREQGYDEALNRNLEAYLWLVLGEADRALAASERAVELVQAGPRAADARRVRLLVLNELGLHDEAADLLREAWTIDGALSPEFYAHALYATGEGERARVVLDSVSLAPVNAQNMALGYTVTGEHDRAFEALEMSVANHDILLVASLRMGSWWDPLRGDARFSRLLQQLDSLAVYTPAFQPE